jgi:hypothetical protein
MSRIAATILSMEALIVLLAVPVAINLSDVSAGAAWAAAVAVVALCVAAAGTVRRGRAGYVLGWIAQVLAVLAGFIVPVMFALGGIFALLWIVLMRIGPEVEAAQAARAAQTGGSDRGDEAPSS